MLSIGGLLFAVKFVMDQYQGIEDDIYAKKTQNEGKAAEKLGVLTSDPGASRTKPAPSPSPTASPAPTTASAAPAPAVAAPGGSAVSATAQPNMVICTRDLDAYNPANPTKLLGKFLKGSVIHLSNVDPVTGMVPVVYKQPNGPDIRALCQAKDVGR